MQGVSPPSQAETWEQIESPSDLCYSKAIADVCWLTQEAWRKAIGHLIILIKYFLPHFILKKYLKPNKCENEEKLLSKNYLQINLACARLQSSATVFGLYLQHKYLHLSFYKLYYII